MTTRLSDAIVPSIFTVAVNAMATQVSRVRQSGVVLQTPAFDALAAADNGFAATMPFWSPLNYAEANSASDDPSALATLRKAGQGSQQTRRFNRNFPFSAMDIVQQATGTDVTAYAVSEFARLWQLDEQSLMFAMLQGIYAWNVDAARPVGVRNDMVSDISVSTGTVAAANRLSLNSLIDARAQLGDMGSQLRVLVAHSVVVNGLRRLEGNAFVPASQTQIGLDTYAGYAIIEDDMATVDTTVANYPRYVSFLMAPGAFGFGLGQTGTAIQRNELAGNGSGQEIVVNRRAFVLHPNGWALTATPANNVSLTNAEVSVAGAWNRVLPRKGVGIAMVRSNG